jgi:hypothetical protein
MELRYKRVPRGLSSGQKLVYNKSLVEIGRIVHGIAWETSMSVHGNEWIKTLNGSKMTAVIGIKIRQDTYNAFCFLECQVVRFRQSGYR